jgi:hypothetical protein
MSEDKAIPPRLAPFLQQWDYIVEVLTARLEGLTDAEFLWEPAPTVWTVRPGEPRPVPDTEFWPPDGGSAPPRTLAWSIDHLGAGMTLRADYLVGTRAMTHEDVTWPLTAAEGVAFMQDGLSRWRTGLDEMTDEDLDTVGRSAYPWGLDPELPLLDIVWWLNKELVFHSAEIWFVRDLYAAREGR